MNRRESMVKKRKPDFNSKKRKGSEKKKKNGPRLPNSLRKEIERSNIRPTGSDDEIESDEANDVYEYEEEIAEEESRKNRRFDTVENYDYVLPENFKDENVLSDDEEEEDDGRHGRMLQGVTGMPSEAFEGKKKRNNVVISEAYPESEYNPSRDVLNGGGLLTIEDLLAPLEGKPEYSKFRKRAQQVERKSLSLQAPLSKPDQEKLDRRAVNKQITKELNKWGPSVKKNREAPTIYFDEDVNLGFSTVGAIASVFEPRTEFEKKMDSVLNNPQIQEAHKEDGAKLLELNELSLEDHIKDRNHIAKMRNLLFRHELKSKRIKKIKSKTFHRLMNKDKNNVASVETLMDPETVKEEAMKREFKRAEERMTLRHKNKSKWAKQVLKLSLNSRDEGTRAALAEQLHMHTTLTRKTNRMDNSSSSDGSSDEDDEVDTTDKKGAGKLLAKATEKTLKVLEETDELPSSGVLSLPFMVRGLNKRNEEAKEEAKLALQDYEKWDDEGGAKASKSSTTSGRRVFGDTKKKVPVSNKKVESDNFYGNSDDSENDMEANEDVSNGPNSVPEKSDNEIIETHQHSELKGPDDVVGNPGTKTTYDVAIFASGSWRKMKDGKVDTSIKETPRVTKTAVRNQEQKVLATKTAVHGQEQKIVKDLEGSDSDSEEEMVDGVLSANPKAPYELPSQAELIRHAFAGDDVADEFEKHKEEILNEENPEPEKPVLVPGWGQWSHIQQKKGLPSWMVKEHDSAKKKREQALKDRKDARFKHVVISEKVDKKALKLQTTTLPFPYTSKDVFEQSMRMPLGPEYNPATAIGALIRPAVVKKSGQIIKPIKRTWT